MSNSSNNKKQFKNSTAYKIIVGILVVLYIGFQIFGSDSDEVQDAALGSTEYSEEQYVENIVEESEVESFETVVYEPSQEDEIVDASTEEAEETDEYEEAVVAVNYSFRSDSLWESHYDKHGIDMGFADKEAYLAAANAVIANPDTLHKIEGEDGDDVYYLEETNEFVVVSTDGYLRTYFLPDDGIDYYNRQ